MNDAARYENLMGMLRRLTDLFVRSIELQEATLKALDDRLPQVEEAK